MTRIAAILTGDLIGSTRAGTARVDDAMTVLAAVAGRLSALAGDSTRFTRFRGDGWQVHLDRPALVLRATLMLAAGLRGGSFGVSTRIAAGVGSVDRLGQTDLSDAGGAAFVASGHALDTMPKARRITLAGPGQVPDWQVAFFHVVDWQAARWSAPQAEALALALGQPDATGAELAGQLGITRQAVQARLNGSGHDALEGMCRIFEGTAP